MVILNLASQAVRALHALRFHPHHANLTFELLFQMLSIRIMSWDFEGADKPLPGRKYRIGDAVEAAAAQILRKALYGVRHFRAE
jgi:hypothetical protein